MKTEEIVDLLTSDDDDEVLFVGSSKAANNERQPASSSRSGSRQKKQPAAAAQSSNAKKAEAASHAKPNATMNNHNKIHNHNNNNSYPGDDPHGPLKDGEETLVQGSSKNKPPYRIKRTDRTYFCSCPAWKMQKVPPARGRTCKHIHALRSGYPANHVNLLDIVAVASSGNSNKSNGNKSNGNPKKRKQGTATAAAATSQKASTSAAAAAAAAEPATFPGVTLAEKWDPQRKHGDSVVQGWMLSEKLDGQRCYWDGVGTLWTRTGNAVAAPATFLQQLPMDGTALDGELFLGRGQFQQLQSVVKSGRTHPGWNRVRFAVFDAVVAGNFHRRAGAAQSALQRAHTPTSIAYWLPHRVCRGVAHVRQELERVTDQGGEGVMLRDPAAPYVHGRTGRLLKVKNLRDAEAVVVAHEPGRGQNAGLMGALRCRMLHNGSNGDTTNKFFKIGTGFSQGDRADPPPVGSTVTYRYQELTDNGLPRFPVFVRVREDL